MSENYRNPIASLNKFPQFTTMNVIDGQAGLASYSSLILYSLTIDNILNIIDACIDDFEIGDKVIIYKKDKNEINVGRSIIVRESIYKKLEEMREKYGISISKLINISIRDGLEKYEKKKM